MIKMSSDNKEAEEGKNLGTRSLAPRKFKLYKKYNRPENKSNQTGYHNNVSIKQGRKYFENKNNVEEENIVEEPNVAAEQQATDYGLTSNNLYKPEERKFKNAMSNKNFRNGNNLKKQKMGKEQSFKINPNHDNRQSLQPVHQSPDIGVPNQSGNNIPIKNRKTNHPRKYNNKKRNLKPNKLNTSEIIEELKLVVSEGGSAYDVEKVTKMLTNTNISVEYEVLFDFIDLVSEICVKESTKKLEILQLVFKKQILDTILTFMQGNTKELTKLDEGKEKCSRFFQNFLGLSALATKLLPGSSLIFLKHTLIFTRTILSRLEGRINITHLHFDFQEMINQIGEKAKMEEQAKEEVSPLDVEHMKTMSVLPTTEDLFGKPPKLKKNIVEGAYKNTDHYLTVQFTLLHEDFISPLREGISEFLSGSSNGTKRKTQVAVFRKVRITHASIDSGKFGHVVQFDEEVKWEFVTRFFLFGSLLLFTTDYFKSFFSATVIAVNNENRTIMVKLDANYFKMCNDIYAEKFHMAVSKVFFEPYYHVLSALQKMASEEFPMKKYIVEVSSESEPPAYISELDKYIVFKTVVDILNPIWPQLTEVIFNQSQQKAFQAALTNEFVAIQGPPGTGKTFLGLQIVKTLLDNKATDSPILVVCYKNHALDQFLEGLLEKTKQIIRIGGRSMNENLKKFNLKHLRGRYMYDEHEKFLKTLAISYFKTKYQMDGLRKHGILSVQNVLPYVVSPKIRAELMNICFEDWLMEGVYMNDEDDKGDEENSNGCTKWSSKITDPVLNESNNHLDNHKQDLCSYYDLEGNSDSLLKLDENGQKRKDQDQRNSITDICIGEEFNFSGENNRRIFEIYNDDYSKIYDDVAQEVQAESLNSEHASQAEGIINYCQSQDLAPYFTITIRQLKEQHSDYEKRVKELLGSEDLEDDEKKYWQLVWETDMVDIIKRISFMKKMLHNKPCFKSKKITEIYAICEKLGIWALSNGQRWLLYHSWVDSFGEDIKRRLINLEECIRFGEQRLDEARSEADLIVLKGAKVVGVTTSGAAMNRSTLNKLGAKIVVIEEAAEVLESHIVTSLSSKCQHLILIGDHKQLRPNPAVYTLCQKYNFDISLFERMVKNGLSCHTLDVQHRMRPEFASLIVPSIYPHLVNHPTTENRPDIEGVHSNLYFINHNHPEEQLFETESHVNKFEAKFALELANYLLLQGYLAEDITILATYSGQVREILKMRDKIMPTKDLEISTVDDFQGEENKIIILSLVRSNEEGNVGFLQTENRVCVALSRAREGLYIIGNMDCLTANSQIWPLVKERLLEHNALGQTLSVYCQNHQEAVTRVKDGDMFGEMPEGGCSRMCQMKLSCGHVCKYHCHPRDQQHQDHYTCSMPCERTCKLEHPCQKLCGDKCGPCMISVEHDLPCGHKKKAACSSDPATLLCYEVLPCVLACGHESTRLCKETTIQVAKKRCSLHCGKVMECGHPCKETCGHKNDCGLYNCQAKVEITCDHEHKFTSTCWERRKGIAACRQIVEKTLDCGHIHSAPCFQYKNPIICPVKVEKMLRCKHTQIVDCGESVDNLYCSKTVLRKVKLCGHKIKAECGKEYSSLVCQEPCARVLKCGHFCKKMCYKPCICSTIVEEELPCGHTVKTKCSQKNVTCDQPCERDLACGHKCQDRCGVKCGVEECQKLALSKVKPACGHDPVIAPCSLNQMGPKESALKLVAFCKAVCGAKLQCGHSCRGICGSCSTNHAHAPCNEPCRILFPCGHRCPKRCSESCGVCYQKCLNRCSHRKCDRICGEPCDFCQVPCDRGCVHKRCRRPCFAICDRRPCPLPCPLPLACSHPCLGFCGERCPPICLLCEPQHPLAAGRNINDRFIVLEDCDHIVNARLMDNFIHRNKSCIVKCPIVSCQIPIIITKRYHKEVTEAFSNIMKLKRHIELNKSNDVEQSKNINQQRHQENCLDQASQGGATSRNPYSSSPRPSRGTALKSRGGTRTSRGKYDGSSGIEPQHLLELAFGGPEIPQAPVNPTSIPRPPHQSSQNEATSTNPYSCSPRHSRGRAVRSRGGTRTPRGKYKTSGIELQQHLELGFGEPEIPQAPVNPTRIPRPPYQSSQNEATSTNPYSCSPRPPRGRPVRSRGGTRTPRGKYKTSSGIEPQQHFERGSTSPGQANKIP